MQQVSDHRESDARPNPSIAPKGKRSQSGSPQESQPPQLSALLVWAVVFCDIGTSVYYVPSILYSQVGSFTPLLVIGTSVGFVFLSWKYAEISWRNPEGGGVVSVAGRAFGPYWGCLGGMLITVDYFLTSAISSVAGMHYLGSVFPFINMNVVPLTVMSLLFLAGVNLVGIRESAALSLLMALAAFTVDLIVIGVTLVAIGPPQWSAIAAHLVPPSNLSFTTFLVGFGGAWLAFSGLESISQLSPAMRLPIRSTSRRGMALVVISIILTSPLLTLFSVALLPSTLKGSSSDEFISELAGLWGGLPLKVAVVLSASALLLFAANTAIIGAYHVFLALAQRDFVPKILTSRNRRFGTPHFAIGVATLVPVCVVLLTRGNLAVLGEMYAFGLLGAFTLSSGGLDFIRWRQGQRGVGFWIGVATTLMVLTAWLVNLVAKQLATFFGGGFVAIGMAIAFASRQRLLADLFYRLPMIAARTVRRISEAERATEAVAELITLKQAQEILALYPSHTLVALRGRNEDLVNEAIRRERGLGGNCIHALYVEERPGLFVGGESREPDEEGIDTLRYAAQVAQREGFTLLPVWTVSYNAAEAIARAAELLGVDTVMMGVSRRSAIYHLLRGHVINGLTRRLPRSCHLLLHS